MNSHRQSLHTASLARIQAVLQVGGSCIYPTETLYALGCAAGNPAAVNSIFSIKSRPRSKPLPLIIGSVQQLEAVATQIHPVIAGLADCFWPGPLSLLLPARSDLPAGLVNREGLVCIRQTSHPQARRLCLDCGFPLVATSANLSRGRPVVSLEDLDPELVARVDAVWESGPAPEGRAPSTIIRLGASNRLHILRCGAISRTSLIRAGFDLL